MPAIDHVARRLAVRRRDVHPPEQQHPDRQHERAEDDVPAVAAGARDELPGEHRRRHRAEHQRRQHDAGRGRRRADHALHEERHVRDRPEHRHADERHARDAPGDDRVAQDLERQDRLARAALDEREDARAAPRRATSAPTTCALVPRVLLAAPDEPEQERADPRREQPAPSQSIECVASAARARGIVSEMTTSATPPTGRLTRKTQRQLALSTMKPPTAGPMIDDAAKTAPISPCQRPRSRGGTMLPITASESGKSPPAPMPCTARKTHELGHRRRERRRAPSRAGRRRSRRGTGSCGRRRRRASRRAARSPSR